MLILLDENLPHKLRRLIIGHDGRTVAYQGWAGLANGALLKAAEDSGFDVIVTADQGIRYQQNRKGTRVALLVLSDNDEVLIAAGVGTVLAAIAKVEPGGLLWVDLAQ